MTPLLEAAYRGNTDIAELLLSHGANLAAKDSDGFTALHKAADHGKAEVVQLLLD